MLSFKNFDIDLGREINIVNSDLTDQSFYKDMVLFVFKSFEEYEIIAELPLNDDKEIFKQISTMNQELWNLTRELNKKNKRN